MRVMRMMGASIEMVPLTTSTKRRPQTGIGQTVADDSNMPAQLSRSCSVVLSKLLLPQQQLPHSGHVWQLPPQPLAVPHEHAPPAKVPVQIEEHAPPGWEHEAAHSFLNAHPAGRTLNSLLIFQTESVLLALRVGALLPGSSKAIKSSATSTATPGMVPSVNLGSITSSPLATGAVDGKKSGALQGEEEEMRRVRVHCVWVRVHCVWVRVVLPSMNDVYIGAMSELYTPSMSDVVTPQRSDHTRVRCFVR
jgi:hypothetical protein